LDKKEKKELERKLKEDEEERGKWAKRREEEYGKKRAEIMKSSKAAPAETKGRGRGRGQIPFSDKYKWVAPGLKNPGEKSDTPSPRERYSNDGKERYSKDEKGGRYSKEESKERYSKEGSKDHGSRYSRDDSKSDKRDKRDSKSDRRRKAYDDDKYTSDSDDERVILKKGERKSMDDDEDDDLRKIINKQRGIVEKDDGKSIVFDYGHQHMENAGSSERTGLKGFFGGAFAHLREDSGPSENTKKEVDSYGGTKVEGNYGGQKTEDAKELEKDLGKDMERTLLLELLKRQFPDIRYLTERQGGLELMQKIFGAHGMEGLAGLELEGSAASARSAASDEGSVKGQQGKQDGHMLSPVQPAEEKKVETKSASQEKRESRRDRRSSSRSRSESRERYTFIVFKHVV
jgi:hypothetical protein